MSSPFESFVAILKRSGLLSAEKLQGSIDEYCEGQQQPDPKEFVQSLIASGELTDWQADKLLKGRHKGFFLGKYKLQRIIGKGGMSSVYLAEHVLMKRQCAIKVLPWKFVKNSSFLDRFYREAQLVAQLDHPNIVRAYDVDSEKEGNLDIHFLVMEYVAGRNLYEIVSVDGPMNPAKAVDLLKQGTAGLAYAHNAGLVHRDIKPGNFIVDEQGHLRLMDLGLARITEDDDTTSLTVANDEKVLGTADYLAPEQAVDSHTVDPRADLYSLGCTLYFMLTGEPPFNEGTLTQRLLAHQTKEPPAIEEKRPDTPADLAEILRKLMQKKPEDRYQTADEVLSVLADWLHDHGYADADADAEGTKKSGTYRKGKPVTSSDAPAKKWEPTVSSRDADSGLASQIAGLNLDVLSKPSKPEDTANLTLSDQPTEVPAPGVTPQPSKKKKGGFKIPRGIAAGVLAVVVLLGVAYLLFRPEVPPDGPVVNDNPPVEPGIERPPVSGNTVTVGPEGNFGTLNEAIQFTRNSWLSGESSWIKEIRIAEGIELAEPVVMDNSALAFSRPLKIIGEGNNPPVFNPKDDQPALVLRVSEQFRLENVRLQGKGRPHVVELQGYMMGTVLNRVVIDGIEQIGVSAKGVQGLSGQRLTFEDCRFVLTSSSAHGMVFSTEALKDTSEITIQRCRFIGPGKAALSFEGATQSVLVRENIFEQLSTGASFSGKDVVQSGFHFLNNTFHKCETGIGFRNGISPYHEKISFSQNLFTEQSGPEVSKGSGEVDVAKLSSGMPPVRYNWTDRSGGGSDELDIFSSDGRLGMPKLTFVSADPESPDYLKPQLQELKSAVKEPVGGLNFIGARSP
ncbi:MAG: protein kinase [Planctomycetaceae bacterium]|nr:protein kinase [Planctomycetaceae bacterium]